VVGQNQIDAAAAQPDEDRLIAGGTPHLARFVAGLEFDAAAAEVPDSFRPNGRPEVAKLLRRAIGPNIHDSVNRHYKPPWRAEADGGGRCHPDEMPPSHYPSRTP
jgi:hypothetical protein